MATEQTMVQTIRRADHVNQQGDRVTLTFPSVSRAWECYRAIVADRDQQATEEPS